jgi:acyl-CoA hydrolase
MSERIRPVVFNVVTIAALLIALVQLVLVSPMYTMPATAEAIQLLAELARENEAVDESLITLLENDVMRRRLLGNGMIVTMGIAILANVVANYLGRGRQRMNLGRIRRLEAELDGMRSAAEQGRRS